MDSSESRDRAGRVWAFRMRFEQEAALRFARLAAELDALGAVAKVVTLAREAAEDERRHAALCAALAARFGRRVANDDVPPPAPAAPSGLSPRERLLYEVVAMSCVTETLSAALLGAMLKRATDNDVATTLRSILRDEVRHARLGWAHLAGETRRGGGAFISETLPSMLAGTVDDEIFGSGADAAEQYALGGLGALPRRERVEIFRTSMTEIVFPGLEHFGIDTTRGREWLDHSPGRCTSGSSDRAVERSDRAKPSSSSSS